MYSHYHPGAFGKDIPGQWSCCQKDRKGSDGCCDSSSIDGAYYTIKRTQSAIYKDKADFATPDYGEKDHSFSFSMPSSCSTELLEESKSLNDIPAYVKFEVKRSLFSPVSQQDSTHDHDSVYSLGKSKCLCRSAAH